MTALGDDATRSHKSNVKRSRQGAQGLRAWAAKRKGLKSHASQGHTMCRARGSLSHFLPRPVCPLPDSLWPGM